MAESPTVEIVEKLGRTLSSSAAELVYVVRHTSDDAAARTELLNAAPASHHGLPRDDAEVEELAQGLWLGTVRYAAPGSTADPAPVGGSSFSFDTTGGTQHITQSLATVASHAASGSAPDFRGAIGVTPEGVQGVDITAPAYAFAETHVLDAAAVTNAYKGTVFALTGKVNSSAFRGLAAGECLFLGAAGSQRDDDAWELTFRFAGSPNRSNFSVGPISGVSKKGWEYLWVRYEDTIDAASQTLVKQPVAAYVERVYEEASFSGLGIG